MLFSFSRIFTLFTEDASASMIKKVLDICIAYTLHLCSCVFDVDTDMEGTHASQISTHYSLYFKVCVHILSS